MKHQKYKNTRIHPAFTVALGMALMFIVSSFINGTNSIFIAPVIEEFGILRSQYMIGVTIFLLTTGTVTPAVGKLYQKYDVRMVHCIASIGCACVCIIRACAVNIYWWWVSWFLLGWVFPVIVTLMLPTLTGRWFSKNVGTVMSIIVMAQGVSDSILNTIGSVIISGFGWRTLEWIWAAGCLIIGIPVSIFLLKSSPEELGIKPWGDDTLCSVKSDSEDSDDKRAVAMGMSYERAVRSKAFYLIVFAVIFASLSSVTGYINIFCQEVGYTIIIAGIITSSNNIGKLIGQAFLGTLSDHISAKTCFVISQTCVIVGIMGIVITAGKASVVVIGFFSMLTGINSAVGNLLFPIMTKEVFGIKDYTMIWAQVARYMSWIGAFASFIWGVVIDVSGSYIWAFALSSLLEIIPIIIIFAGKKVFDSTKQQWSVK